MTSFDLPNPSLAQTYPETDSCYLDGRYFALALSSYPGLLEQPLVIIFRESAQKNSLNYAQAVEFELTGPIDKRQPGLLRVVIDTPQSRHSNLVILDYPNGQAYRFEPLGTSAPYFEDVNRAIKNILRMFELTLNVVPVEESLNEKHPDCQESGYCNAYNILYALSFLENQNFDPNQIRRFVSMIEEEYGPLRSDEEPEVEYGPYEGQTGQPQNVLAGGLIGGLAGGLLLGPPGILLGGLGGAAIGSTVRT